MRRVIIVEDETAAAVNLRNMLRTISPESEVLAVLESVEEAVEYFRTKPEADVVFMDIHLADGDSFSIFHSVDIDIPIIFTTAYDEYALQAFKVNRTMVWLRDYLTQHGVTTTIRASRGQDIWAACGLLNTKNKEAALQSAQE